MAGAHVFPGGTLDRADLAAAGASPDDAELPVGDGAAMRRAGIREVFEECGALLVTPAQELDRDREATWRKEVHADAPRFEALCAELDCEPDLDSLLPWARWITPTFEPRRFDAMFYLAALRATPRAAHDRHETVSSVWMSPEEALDAHAGQELFLPPPTWYVLREMRASPRLDDLVAYARAGRDLSPTQPHMLPDAGKMVLALPGDAVHPDTPKGREKARHRIVLDGTRYELVRRDGEGAD